MDAVRDFLDAGVWHSVPAPLAAVAFTLVCVVGVTAFVPKSLFAPAAGALFGLAGGMAVTIVGATIGSLFSLMIGRRAGRERVRAWLLRRRALAELDRRLSRDGLLPVAVLRMIPVLPTSVVSYGAAATDIRNAPFVIGTALGMIPMTLVQVAAGASLRDGLSAEIIVSATAGCLVVAAGSVLVRRGARRRAQAG